MLSDKEKAERFNEVIKQLDELIAAMNSSTDEIMDVTEQDYEEAGLSKDDFQEAFFEAGQYADEMPEHPNCSGTDHLDFLTISDLNVHEFMCYILNPSFHNTMAERFVRTFAVHAVVPAGQWNH